MKIIITTLTLIIYTAAGAQDLIPKVDGEYEYGEVVVLDSLQTKDALYKKAKVYFVDAFKSANDVIQYDDREEGKIIGKGFMEIKATHIEFIVPKQFTWDVYYTTDIVCKDGKYKYRLYNISIKESRTVERQTTRADLTIDEAIRNTQKGVDKKATTKLYTQLVQSFDKATAQLKRHMAQSTSKAKDDF